MKKKSYPKNLQQAKAPARQPAAPARAPYHLLPRIVIGAVLLLAAIVVPILTINRVRSEILLNHTTALIKLVPDSQIPEVELRKAIKLDPHNAEARGELAEFILLKERQRTARAGSAYLSSPEKLRETSELLDDSLRSLPSPKVRRRKGEVQMMLAQYYEREGNHSAAKDAREQAYLDHYIAAHLLPRPRTKNEVFNTNMFSLAQVTGNTDVALRYLHQVDRFGQRYAFSPAVSGLAEQTWLRAGMLPHQSRELRAKLAENPADRRTLQAIGLSARDLGMDQMMRVTLEDFDRRGLLNTDGKRVLAWLRDEPTTGTTTINE